MNATKTGRQGVRIMRQYMGKEKCSAVDITMDRIIQYLQDEGLSDGDRLPTERELCLLLGVSRSTLREALQRLETRNVLEIRRGVGTFVSYKQGVADDPLGFTLIRDKEKLVKDLLEFRILIEPRVASMAALNATAEEVEEMEYLCREVDDKIRAGEPHMQKDQEFHTRIARSSGSVIMPKLLPIIQGGIGVFIQETGGQLRDETMRTHHAIVNAIRAHDANAASDAMYLHLVYNRDRLRLHPISTGGAYQPEDSAGADK